MKTKDILVGTIATVLLLCGLFTFIGCDVYSDISVTSDSSVNFSKYKTFAWLPDKMDSINSPYNNEIIRNNLKNYFGQSLSKRNFSVDLDTPDVLFQIVIENKVKEKLITYPDYPRQYYYCQYYFCSDYYSPYAFDYYYRHYDNLCYSTGYCKEKFQYVEGSITLNMIDRQQNKLIWAATAKGDIYDPAYVKQNIHPAVKRIMEKFPVKVIDNR